MKAARGGAGPPYANCQIVFSVCPCTLKLFGINIQGRPSHPLLSGTPATTSLSRSTLCLPKYNHNGECMELTHRKEPMSSSLSPYLSKFCVACWLELTFWRRRPEEEIVDQ